MAHADFSQAPDGDRAEGASRPPESGVTVSAVRRRERRWVWRSAIGGGLFLLVGLVLLLVLTPRGAALEREFAAARPCGAGSASPDCLRTTPAAVRDVTKVVTRSDRYWLTLALAGGGERRVKMVGTNDLAAAVSVGDEVRATLWRGEVRYVTYGRLRQDTSDTPKGAHRPWEAAGLGSVLFCVGLLWCAYWLRRHAADSPASSPWQIVVPMGGTSALAAVGGLAPLFVASVWGAVAAVAAAAVPVAVVCAIVISGRRRQKSDTIEVAVRVPDGEHCFPGSLRGAVPYEVPGYDYLVVGPAFLATTPDPTGAFARRAVPGTLEPVRVRPPYRADPWPALADRFVVVECREDRTPVFVAVHRHDAGVLLGALRAARAAHLTDAADEGRETGGSPTEPAGR